MTPTSELLVGRYRLHEVIGQGGMATVYRARDETLARDVAVKVLRPGYAADPSFVERFRREARHAASLQHPNIVTIHDTGIDPEAGDFIVMNLVDGPDLQSILERTGAQSVGFAVRMGIETAQALQAAHDSGIIHRDVKPGNILIDRNGEARVADFGIARAVSDIGATTAGSILGSVQYTSPEQVVGDQVSPRSDIYALGIVLYETLSGVRPFDGTTPAAVALQRLQVDPRPLREVRPDIPADLEDIVMRALKRNPDERYPSAADMGGELERFRIAELGGVRRRGFNPRAVRQAVPQAGAVGTALALDADADAVGLDIEPWAFDETVVTRGLTSADQPEPGRRRTPALAILGAIGLVAMSLMVLLGTASILGVGFGGAPDKTSGPGASEPAVSRASTEATPTLLPSPSPTPTPIPSPTPTEPTPPEPSPAPTPQPTPEPTPPPTDPPAAGAAAPGVDPAETVSSFYDLVEQHEFDAAASLWSPRMREEYPPGGNINGRFGPTTRIDIDRLSIRSMDLEAGAAVVNVAITEYRENGDVRRFDGRWDLVLLDGRWLIDEPHF